MATNPVVSMPDADAVRSALAECELVVVSDCVRNSDTARLAHVNLPALGWGEKDGTVTNSERRISRQRAFLPAPGEAKPDWWMVTEVAKRMGFADAFNYSDVAQIFSEHAALSGFENKGERAFDISYFTDIDRRQYDSIKPIQWPVTSEQPNGTDRFFGKGRYFTASGKARFIAVSAKLPRNPPTTEFPLVLNTGRIRDQWHTMTRTGKAPSLNSHLSEPFIQISADDARRFGVQDKQLCEVKSAWGTMAAKASITNDQQRGTLFIPMHWNDQFSSHARVNAVVNPEVDPISGQPELKHTPVTLRPLTMKWFGFVMCREPISLSGLRYWSKIKGSGYYQYELADENSVDNVSNWVKQLLPRTGDWLEFSDKASHRYRSALIVDQQLLAVVFISPNDELPSRSWLQSLFSQPTVDDQARTSLLTGKPPKGQVDNGPIVCACFQVGRNVIEDAIRNKKANTVEAIGSTCKAGTNCGSCVPELKKMLSIHR